MNETKIKKTGVILCLVVFIAIIIAQSVIYNQSVRRTDTEINQLTILLAESRERAATCRNEIEDSRTTITECYNAVGRIADKLGEDSGTLQSIIANLKVVREEVAVMEDSLNYFYDKYGDDIHSTDSHRGDVE